MKSSLKKLTVIILSVLPLVYCGRNSSVYTLALPEAPKEWTRLLGEPDWRIEWFDSSGRKQSMDIPPGKTTKIEIPDTWTNPVAAYPYWQNFNLIPGLFKPAGALFPHDAFGGKLHLTWRAGVDAVFYFELVYANSENSAKIPSYFDWIRFRELFETGVLREDVCIDPWLVDWRSVAERTISGNFDRRRLIPQTAVSLNVPLPVRRWYGTSPFAEQLIFNEGEELVFKTYPGVNAWISNEGILRSEGKVWFFTPFD